MSVLAKILGRLIFCLGVMITVVGCVIGSTVGATSGTTMPGVTLMAVGRRDLLDWLDKGLSPMLQTG
jgi:hypothetical protein